MNKADPIPGPWTVESDPVCLNALVYGKGRKKGQRKQLVAQVWSGDDCSLEVALANAQRISAAPDLLSALKDTLNALLTVLEGTDSPQRINQHPAVVSARAAIAKAETATS